MTAWSVVIASSSLVFSVLSFLVVRWESRELEKARKRLQEALFDLQRDATFEAKLGDWPSALRLHGIDVEDARGQDVSPHDIAYLILSVGALCAFCNARDLSVSDHLAGSDYRQRLFSTRATRKTWAFARRCIPQEPREAIDQFLKARYQEDYDRV